MCARQKLIAHHKYKKNKKKKIYNQRLHGPEHILVLAKFKIGIRFFYMPICILSLDEQNTQRIE